MAQTVTPVRKSRPALVTHRSILDRTDSAQTEWRQSRWGLVRAAARPAGRTTGRGGSREVTNGSFVASKLTEDPRASATASVRSFLSDHAGATIHNRPEIISHLEGTEVKTGPF